MTQPQQFIGTAVAVLSWRDVLKKSWPVLLTLAIIITALLIKSQMDTLRVKAANSEAQRVAAEANAKEWKEASGAQSAAIGRLEVTLETMKTQIEARDVRFAQQWANTARSIAKIEARAQALVDAPAAAPQDEIPVARAKLKDTKGYGLVQTR